MSGVLGSLSSLWRMGRRIDWLYWFIFHVNLHCLPEASATSQVLTKYFTVFGKQCLYVYVSPYFPHLEHFQHLVQPSLTFLHFLLLVESWKIFWKNSKCYDTNILSLKDEETKASMIQNFISLLTLQSMKAGLNCMLTTPSMVIPLLPALVKLTFCFLLNQLFLLS